MTLLAIEHLSVRYGARTALEDATLSVSAGEIVALVGASGSGKSTLAAAIPALLPRDAHADGRIALDGVDLATLDERGLEAVRGARIGMVFQEPATALNPALTIGRQIGEVLERHTDLGRAAIAAEVRALLDRVGLDVAPDRHPHMLSGGQRQRVAIAMAIAAGPALLIADEPTAALDPIAQAGVMALLVRLVRERGMGLLLVAHDLALVAGVADRIVVLDGGRVVEQGATAALLDAPASAPLARMVAAMQLPPRMPNPIGKTVIAAAQVSRAYPIGPGLFARARHVALAGVSLSIATGETLAVIGASGSGKSTLARLLLGLDRPDTGVVRIDGQSWQAVHGRERRALQAGVGAVFQDPAASFDPRQTVAQIVAEPLHLATPRPTADARAAMVAAALAEVGLPADAADRLPAQFSGGQRQRIAIARALILRPRLIVFDEALSALDAAIRADIVALLLRLQVERGLAYLFVSHDPALVRAMADRVMVLHDGRVAEEGTVAQVLDTPRDPHTAALVGTVSPAGSRPPRPTGPA
ncbi:dipeptide ABC transporter ATP-binding protein [Sphingomonas nostoxanthinifaciens]|uniref:dipeptide ABC transporter ATP-binding protein n=1 Tax=Sphingomonas nostoxanthinifaciens TaxID=2872652 RepID=UPI001CC211A7|nr:ABC transporter ATP-binding protein [Sphingomonas nostoxanthinifaciens]UAK25182.1 ABC transporter ATP-binding protein [Sphingomonas nostoxanthinifaciens]